MPKWSRAVQSLPEWPWCYAEREDEATRTRITQGRVGDVLFLGGKSQSWLRVLLCSVQRRVFLALLVTTED